MKREEKQKASRSAALALAASLALGACSRHADIRDEPDASLVKTPVVDAGDIPDLDAGLGTDAYQACPDRLMGACVGPSDFPCGFTDWVTETASSCQIATDCHTNGWLEVHMGSDGCVAAIGMDEPNDAILACLLAQFGTFHCPCNEEKATYYFGQGNHGVCGPHG